MIRYYKILDCNGKIRYQGKKDITCFDHLHSWIDQLKILLNDNDQLFIGPNDYYGDLTRDNRYLVQ